MRAEGAYCLLAIECLHISKPLGPIECVVRFESGVVFMRPQDLGAFVKKEEEEDAPLVSSLAKS